MGKLYLALEVRSGRELLLRILGRLHFGLIVAVLYAMVWAIVSSGENFLIPFFRGLTLIAASVLSFYAEKKLRLMWQFLLVCLGISLLSWLLMGNIAGLFLSAVVCFFRGRARLSEVREESLFDSPHPLALLLFLVPFLCGAGFEYFTLQKLCLISAVCYALVCLAFYGLQRIDGYLKLNEGMQGLPSKRILRTAGLAVALMTGAAALLLIPAAWFGFQGLAIDFSALEQGGLPVILPGEPAAVSQEQMDFSQLLPEGQKPWFEIPPFVFYLVYALCIGGILLLVIYGIYRIIRSFRSSFTDSRDLIQFLSHKEERKEAVEKKRLWKRPSLFDRSPNSLVRRRYRKEILRSAKERPRASHTPQELEAAAGLLDPALHDLYEKARYSAEGCTPEEAREVKS